MTWRVLAVDYDGTIAHDGVVARSTVEALKRVRATGRRLVLVTGRELTELFNTFPDAAVFDRIVGENGAVLLDPSSGSLDVLAGPPDPRLVETLTRLNVPFSAGHTIVATFEPHERHLYEIIREHGLPWQVIPNKGAFMALPESVNKGSGLTSALAALGAEASETIGVGDAENDESLLRACGLAVAVSNALPSLKAIAHVVTAGARGAGVEELVDAWLTGRIDPPGQRQTDVPT